MGSGKSFGYGCRQAWEMLNAKGNALPCGAQFVVVVQEPLATTDAPRAFIEFERDTCPFSPTINRPLVNNHLGKIGFCSLTIALPHILCNYSHRNSSSCPA